MLKSSLSWLAWILPRLESMVPPHCLQKLGESTTVDWEPLSGNVALRLT